MIRNKVKRFYSRLSSDVVFYFFWIAALILSIVISISVVGGKAEETLLQLQKRSSESQANLSASALSQYLDTRLKLMQDLAASPLLTNSVMGSVESSANLHDFMEGYYLLGRKEELYIFDILGSPIYTNSKHSINSENKSWFSELLNGGSSHILAITERSGGSVFSLAVPVVYNGYREGVLLAIFSDPIEEIVLPSANSQDSVELSGEFFEFSMAREGIQYSNISTRDLENFGLKFSFLQPLSVIDSEKKGYMEAIALSVVASLGFSFLVLMLLGRRMILNPFKRLKISEGDLRVAQENNEFLIQALELSPIGISITDGRSPDMPLIYVNAAFSKITGYSKDEVIGKNCRFLQGEFTDKATVEKLKQAIEKREECHVDLINYKKDGETFWNSLTISPLYDHNDEFISYVGVQLDITEKVELQDYVVGITQESPSLLAYVDKNEVYQFNNRAYEHWFGVEPESLKGKTLKERMGEEPYRRLEPYIKRCLQGEMVSFEEYLPVQDGTENAIRANYTPNIDQAGVVQGFFVSVDDITVFRKAERDQKEARKIAEGASKAKSQFLASMSHEIRTPMNGVLGMLRMLGKTPLNDDQKHRLHLATSSAESLLSLINDILDFSKIDAGKLTLESIDFDLRKLLGDFAESAAHSAQDKGVEIVLDNEGINESLVAGDPSRVRQIITNIVGNAIKFTATGEVIIRSRLDDIDRESLLLTCTVTDTGIGIPEDRLEDLFESFTQVDASTTRKFGGTGLGLAISKKLCGLMGGDINVESKEGWGSQFTFTLKLKKSEQSQHEFVFPSDLSELSVLLLDDNSATTEAISRQFTAWGISVDIADSIEEGKDVYEGALSNGEGYDAVIVDREFGKPQLMDLLQVISQESSKSVAKVLSTRINLGEAAQEKMEEGFDYYYPKPATTEDLLGVVYKILSEKIQSHAAGEESGNDSRVDQSYDLSNLAERSKARILLVEDNQINQFVAIDILEDLGFTNVDVAENGVEALACMNDTAGEQPYAMVLMDCQMPEMDGYEATRKIRSGDAGSAYGNVYILAMTANAMQGDREKCIQAGMDDYLAKPIDPDLLREKLCQASEEI
ncbi:MAG: response regulator [Cellvibrionaceae bacterium]